MLACIFPPCCDLLLDFTPKTIHCFILQHSRNSQWVQHEYKDKSSSFTAETQEAESKNTQAFDKGKKKKREEKKKREDAKVVDTICTRKLLDPYCNVTL